MKISKKTSFILFVTLVYLLIGMNVNNHFFLHNFTISKTNSTKAITPKVPDFSTFWNLPETNVSRKDLPYAVIHVGPHKTGSTSLQNFIVKNHILLQADNYRWPSFPNLPRTSHSKKISWLAQCFYPETEELATWYKCKNEKRTYIMDYFENFINESVTDGTNMLLSSEDFSQKGFNATEFGAYLVPHYQVHIVLYYRRFYDYLFSYHNQLAKNNLADEYFSTWLSDDVMDLYSHIHAFGVYNRFSQIPGFNVSVVNLHHKINNTTPLATFFCDHVDQGKKLCEIASKSKEPKLNPSVNVLFEKMKRMIKKQYKNIDQRNRTNVARIKEKYANVEKPIICPQSNLMNRLLELSLDFERALTPEWWYNSEQGLQDLRRDFQEKITLNKFCCEDVVAMLNTTEWKEFLTNFR